MLCCAGKTLIARQIGKMLNGKEPKVVNGPEILNKYVGASEENVRNLFKVGNMYSIQVTSGNITLEAEESRTIHPTWDEDIQDSRHCPFLLPPLFSRIHNYCMRAVSAQQPWRNMLYAYPADCCF